MSRQQDKDAAASIERAKVAEVLSLTYSKQTLAYGLSFAMDMLSQFRIGAERGAAAELQRLAEILDQHEAAMAAVRRAKRSRRK